MIHRDASKSKIPNPKVGDTPDLSAPTEREVNRISNAIKMRTLTYLLFFVFPIFPMIYLLAMAGFLGFNGTLIAFQIAGIVAKLLFAALAVKSHINAFDRIVALVDAEIQPMIQKIVYALDMDDWANQDAA